MKILYLLLFSVLFTAENHCQNYFQQAVSYQIKVTLDDKNHYLRGDWALTYTNNSNDTLTFIYLHLYPNAYKNRNTDLGKQLTADGNLGWYFEKEDARGFIDSLAFSCNGKLLSWDYKKGYLDIAKVELAQPLLPAQTINISSPMRIKIPKSVSRLGHVEQSYQITQWYPKPAVYDKNGWHEMPYLNQGEFYSEFGSYQVSISLPQNYVVAASGDLLTANEVKFLQQKSIASSKLDFKKQPVLNDTFPVSDKKFKTIEYKIDSAHDFAFFADKRYFVIADSVQLKNGHTVRTYAMFTNVEADLWANSSLYLKRSIDFYSNTVGFYPYNQVTAVQSALGAGGGMEYPTVTVIGETGTARALEVVIMHEVGHNWFYGILGSNERTDAWQDEGFNSYIESRYEDAYLSKENIDQKQLAFLYQARRGEEQPICTHSQDATPINYYLTAYAKPTMLLRHLERYLGTNKMDKILHKYFDTWKFRHPNPADVQSLFEAETGENLSWFFTDWLRTTKVIDYAVHKQRFANDSFYITVRNKGELTIPISLNYTYDSNSQKEAIWINNLKPQQDTLIKIKASTQTVAELDAYNNVPDISPSNNSKLANKLSVGFIPNFKKITAKRLNLLPLPMYNKYDGFMLGVFAYNNILPMRNWQYILSPVFAFGSKSLVGMAEVAYNHVPSQHRPYQRLTISLSLRSFHNQNNSIYNYQTRYTRLNNIIELELPRTKQNSKIKQELTLQNLVFAIERPNFTSIVRPDTLYFVVNSKSTQWRSTHRLQYAYANKRKLNPYSFNTILEYANYKSFAQTQHYLKMSAELNHKFMYNAHSAADIRLFAAGFAYHSDRNFGAFPLQVTSRNQNDYQYDNLYLGRNQQTGFFSQQIALQDAGFKTLLPQSVGDGHTNKFLVAANFKTAIPLKLGIGAKWIRIKPYLDVAYFVNSEPSVQITSIAQTLFYNGGLMIDVVNGAAGIYFPMFSNQALSNMLQSRGNYWTRISFSVNTQLLNPIRVVRKIELI